MNRELAKQLKLEGFPIERYRSGHKFYPSQNARGWSDAARTHSATINQYELENYSQDIKNVITV